MNEDSKNFVRRVFDDLLNQRNVGLYDELFASDCAFRSVATPGETSDLEQEKQRYERTRTAFPDFRVTVDDIFAEGGKVAVSWTFQGTHTGDLPSIPATGRHVIWGGIDIFRLQSGEIVEDFTSRDTRAFLEQLGAA